MVEAQRGKISVNTANGRELVKPKLRGVFHEIAFFISLLTGPILIILANGADRFQAGVYSISLSSMFGASALYHRPNWKPRIRLWWRRLDHSMIFVFIAGTFTPIAFALPGNSWARHMLFIIWMAAIGGMLLQFLPWQMPKWVAILPYLAIGWLAPSIMPATYRTLGLMPLLLLIAGGVFYTVGAIAYAKHAPNIKPGVFGYHEFFHVLVIGAVICHYAAVMMAVT